MPNSLGVSVPDTQVIGPRGSVNSPVRTSRQSSPIPTMGICWNMHHSGHAQNVPGVLEDVMYCGSQTQVDAQEGQAASKEALPWAP